MDLVPAPIVPNARYTVRCSCGCAYDSASPTESAALESFSCQHRHTIGSYTVSVKAFDAGKHPLYQEAARASL